MSARADMAAIAVLGRRAGLTDAEAAAFAKEISSSLLADAADSLDSIHAACARGRKACSGCAVRADMLDVLRSVADVIGGGR